MAYETLITPTYTCKRFYTARIPAPKQKKYPDISVV